MNQESCWPASSLDRVLLAIVVLFPFLALGTPPLFDLDEGAFTAATTEMFLRGDFLSTYLLGEPRYDKPILIYWLQAAAVSLLGSGSEFAWRLPSALASSLWILATYGFVAKLLNHRAGLAAALIIATAAGLTLITHAATADALLNLCLACAGYATWLWLRERKQRWLYAAWAAMALGFLAKGPIALLIPAGTLFLWCATRRDWRSFFSWLLAPGPLLLFLAVAVPWFAIQAWHEGPGFLTGFFFKHNLSRFDMPMQGHGGGLFYYIPVVLLSLLPHTALLLIAGARIKAVWNDELLRFGLLWFLLAFITFSLSGTKLPHYVYYGYGGLVVILAAMAGEKAARLLLALTGSATFALLLALPSLLDQAVAKLKPDDLLLTQGLPAHFGATYWLWCGGALVITLLPLLLRSIPSRLALCANGLLAGATVALFLLPIVGQVQQGPVKQAGRLARDLHGPLLLYGINTPSLQTYAGRQVEKRPPRAGDLVLTRESRLAELPANEVVFRERSYVLARIKGP
ncbi:MAG: phospholipid carrier-dependent glycosyltransferase [Hydrogenophilales bacterium CG17_big_fil_post_rev_8_21_14_2_50_63_12]|nr:MAG: phospholipid carrier-dependent glycosyltransferase [Hydrogenophilales bacterium CG17_big_fil_post_rev_8_21_14_2_50_63_12]